MVLNMKVTLPCLYSFRRCPYAIRARLGILFATQIVELREIILRDKPAHMLEISPKGTVPVLQLASGQVIEESREIVEWALGQQDSQGLLEVDLIHANALIDQNDTEFKHWLDRYKYADRYPENSQLEYRQHGEAFLQVLEGLLSQNNYLLGNSISLADIAIMPFVRQFAHVDRNAFYGLPYPQVQHWLRGWLEHPVFLKVMAKYPPWQEGDEPTVMQ